MVCAIRETADFKDCPLCLMVPIDNQSKVGRHPFRCRYSFRVSRIERVNAMKKQFTKQELETIERIKEYGRKRLAQIERLMAEIEASMESTVKH